MNYTPSGMDQVDNRSQRSSTLPRLRHSGYSHEFGYSSEPRQKVTHVSFYTLVFPVHNSYAWASSDAFIFEINVSIQIHILAMSSKLAFSSPSSQLFGIRLANPFRIKMAS